MKQFGLPDTQELVSLQLNADGSPRFDSLRPQGKWALTDDDAPWNQEGADPESDWSDSIWTPPTIIPLIKLPQPQLNPLTEYCEPKLVWFEDRVERDWEIKQIPQIPPEQITEQEARKAAKLAIIEKQKLLYAPYVVQPENFSLATTVEDQNAFTRLLTLLTLANALDDSTTTISDSSGVVHQLTVARFKEIMISYGLEIHQRWIQYK